MVNAKKLLGLILSLSLISGSLVTGSIAQANSAPLEDSSHVFAYEDFSDYNLDAGTSIEGKKNWTMELVNTGSRGTTFTLEDEPGNISNKTLKINHHTKHTSSKKLTSERFGQNFGSTVSGKVEFSFRIKPIDGETFSFHIISGAGSTTATLGTLARLEVVPGKAHSSFFTTADATSMEKRPKYETYSLAMNEWNTFYLAVDTKKNTFEIKISDEQGSGVQNTYTAYFPAEIGGFRMEIPRDAAVSTIYVDDIYSRKDMSDELLAAKEYVTENLISDGPLDELTENIKQLPVVVGENGSIGVEWSSSNPDAINVKTGEVTPRKYSQSCTISAKITLDAQTEFVKNASTVKEFPVTVLPYGEFTDGEMIDDFLDNYLNEKILSDEPLNAVTKNLKTLPTEGPDGITLEWSASEGQDYLKNDGSVKRPDNGENETVTLTVKAIKGNAEREKSFNITILYDMSPQYKVEQAKKELVASKITGERPESITKNLSLDTEGLYDTEIEWSSNKPEVITNEGVVSRGNTDQVVVMKAHIMYKDDGGEIAAEDYVEIELTVKMSAQAMAEKDGDEINLAEGIVERTFTLPVLGSIYKSSITWKSNHSSIEISKEYAVVTPPGFEDGDANVTLTAEIRNEDTTVTKEFHFIVEASKSDAQLVNEVYNTLDSVLGHTTGDSIKDNLAFKTSFANGVKCKWESDSSIIESNGEVNNPAVGEGSATVTVTATVYKNSAEMEKTYTFTVLPFESDDEIIEKAAQMLSFSKLSSDEITAVKKQLELPKNWKYNTQIEWESSDESLISIMDDTNRKIGLVQRPASGNGDGKVTLTAKITYNGQERIKHFYITVKEDAAYVTELLLDNETGTLGATPVIPKGRWKTLPENCSFSTDLDPEDEGNQVIRMFREKATQKPSGTAYSHYDLASQSYAVDGHAIVKLRLYIGKDTQNTISFRIRSYGGESISVRFDNDGKIYYTPDSKDATDKNFVLEGTRTYERGKWLNLKFDIDNPAKKFHFYIDDVLMTENGYIKLNGQPYDTKTGVKMIINSNENKTSDVYGFQLYLVNEATTTDSIVYLDDFCIMQEVEYPVEMTEVMDEFEIEFLSKNTISQIREDLVIPSLINDDFTMKLYSDNTAVVTSEGKVIRPQNDTDVVFTASFTDGTYTSYRKYNLKVKAYDPAEGEISGDITELLQGDLEKIIADIKANYQLSSLTGNISLPKTGENGSIVTYTSSDTAVITADGVITRTNKNTSATLTVTVAIGNDNSLSDTIDVTVRANSSTVVLDGGSGGSGGSGGRGTGIMIGQSTVKDTGIDIPENKTVYFSDVQAEHWAYDYVAELYKKGIISRAESFRPSDSITRAELLKMIICASETEIVEGENGDFSDVSVLDWYAPYIAVAKNMGIVNGREDNTFAPNENISRQDAAVICYNAALAKNYILDKNEGITFSDDSQIADYAKEAVEALSKSAVINGSNGAFSPINQLTRAEAAAIISRLIAYQ